MSLKRVIRKVIPILLIVALLLPSTSVFASVENVSEGIIVDNAESIDDQLTVQQSVYSDYTDLILENEQNRTVQQQVYGDEQSSIVIDGKRVYRTIIKYKTQSGRDNVTNKIKGKLKSIRRIKNKNFDVVTTELKHNELLNEIKKQNLEADIEYIQPDYVMTLSSADKYFSAQWGLSNETSGFEVNIDSNVIPAWSITEGEGSVVAVIDTGIDITHSDLGENIWVNPGEIPENGVDDDGNGYIDDVNGWNFSEDTNIVHEYQLANDEGHGTHIAGIIAAVKDNNLGIAGVAPKSKVMVLKAFSNGTAYTSDIMEAIDYASAMGVKIVNCSWGSTAENPALRESIEGSGMLFVCAAGNSGVSIDDAPVYPASYSSENIITVASIGKNGNLSSFSNFGEVSVDIAAPGESVVSTLPGNTYGLKSGTSMTAPFVAGQAALLLSKNIDASAKDLKDAILNSSDRLSTLVGKVYRANKLNCANSLTGVVNEEIININEDTTIINNTNNNVNNVQDGFTTFAGASTYSGSYEVTDSIFSLPPDTSRGVLNAVLKGNMRSNLLTLPKMDQDVDGNGVVDGFSKYTHTGITASYSFDTLEKCQKIEITGSTVASGHGAFINQSIDVTPGEVISLACEAKVEGNVRVYLYVGWWSKSTYLSTSVNASYSGAEFGRLKNLNIVAPPNSDRVEIKIKVAPIGVGDTGAGWIKNAVVEKRPVVEDNFFSGAKHNRPIRIKSIGKNIFNGKLKSGEFVEGFPDRCITADYLPVIPGTYCLQKLATPNQWSAIAVYDINRNFISYISNTPNSVYTFGVPENGRYIKVKFDDPMDVIEKASVQITKALVESAYESYRESDAYIPVDLLSLPNGQKNEINLSTAEYKKAVGKHILDGNIEWSSFGSDSKAVWAYLTNWRNTNNSVAFGSANPSAAVCFNDQLGCLRISDSFTYANSENTFRLYLPKANTGITDLTSFKQYLNNHPVTLIYQLENPEVYKLDVEPVTCYENGTIVIDYAVKNVGVYNNGLAVKNKELPIESIESIYKIINGARLRVDKDKITLAPNGLSFTIVGAQWGEMYEYVYSYDPGQSIVPTIKYSVPTNLDAQMNDNTEAIRQHSQEISNLKAEIQILKEQIQNPTRVNAGPFKITCTPGTPFNMVLTAANSKDFSSRKFTVIYNSNELEVTDLCAATPTLETGVGNPVDTNISIIKVEPGIIEFIIYNPVDKGKAWSGAVNTIIFTPKSGITSATVTYIAE
ncbi:MAG: S8 family peptidase [Bacillota bacterium]